MSQIVLDGAYLHTTPGIYAFLGLATLPRFRTQENGEPLPFIVACATPAVPPSLLEAAANPRHAWEHIAAGELVDVSEFY